MHLPHYLISKRTNERLLFHWDHGLLLMLLRGSGKTEARPLLFFTLFYSPKIWGMIVLHLAVVVTFRETLPDRKTGSRQTISNFTFVSAAAAASPQDHFTRSFQESHATSFLQSAQKTAWRLDSCKAWERKTYRQRGRLFFEKQEKYYKSNKTSIKIK